jgi:HEAT repeat protein
VKDFNFEVWRMQTQSDVRGLINTLGDANPLNRRAAAVALRALASPSAIPGVQDALMRESEPELREVLVTTLEFLFAQNKIDSETTTAQISDNRNIVRLIARLSAGHTEQAVRAAQELGDSREKLTVEALLMTFNNRKLSARIRLAVAEALIKLQSAPAEVTLLAALRSEKWMVRRNAAGILGQLEADWAVEPLLKALRDPIEAVRRVAQAALERIGTPEAIAAVRLPLPDADTQPAAPPAPLPANPIVSALPSKSALDSPELARPKPEPLPLARKPTAFNWSTMFTEPLLDEEDTKPLRPVPDDVS